jgi:hypothetical protein
MPQFAISEMDAEDAEDAGSPWVAAGGDEFALRARMATGQGGDMAGLYTTATEVSVVMKGDGSLADATWGQDGQVTAEVVYRDKDGQVTAEVVYRDKDGLSLGDFSETAKLLADEINDKTDKEQKEKDDKEKEQKEKEQKEKEKHDKEKEKQDQEKEKQDQEKEETPPMVVEYGLFDDKDYQSNKPKIPEELVENIKSLDDLVKDCNDSMKKFRAISLRLDEMLTAAKEGLTAAKESYALLKETGVKGPALMTAANMVKTLKKEILVYQAQIDLVHRKTEKHAYFLSGCKQPEAEKISGKPPAPEESEETMRTMNGDEITDPITGEIINFDQFLARYSVNNPAHNQTIVTTLSKSSFTITLKEKFEFCKDEEFEVSFFEIDENPASEIPNYDESEVLKELYFRASNSDNSSLRLDDRFNVVFDALVPEEHMVYDIEEECKTNTTIWSRSTMEDSSLSIRDAYNDKQFVIPACEDASSLAGRPLSEDPMMRYAQQTDVVSDAIEGVTRVDQALLGVSATKVYTTSSSEARRRANNAGVNLLESMDSGKIKKDANDMQSMAKTAAKLAAKLTDSGKNYK